MALGHVFQCTFSTGNVESYFAHPGQSIWASRDHNRLEMVFKGSPTVCRSIFFFPIHMVSFLPHPRGSCYPPSSSLLCVCVCVCVCLCVCVVLQSPGMANGESRHVTASVPGSMEGTTNSPTIRSLCFGFLRGGADCHLCCLDYQFIMLSLNTSSLFC